VSTPTPLPSPKVTEPQVPIKPKGFVATGGGTFVRLKAATSLIFLAHSVPNSITISSIGVKAKLVSLGLDSVGAMEVPTTGEVAGWFNGAPTPGEIGPAVIVGHVDWGGKIGVFYKLKSLKKGDLVKVLRNDGKQVTFSVIRVLTVDKLQFPTDLVYGDIDYAGLRLITCGGKFDTKLKRHVDNIIVFAKAVV
jgi:sortase (surface protein transpeptidase)